MNNITIYLKNKETLRFERVSKVYFGNRHISFEYISASRNTKCAAKFFLDNIAGYSEDLLE